MAKFDEVFPDTAAIFKKTIAATNLGDNVSIKVLTNNKLKELGKVVKATDLLKHMTGEDIVILLNESVFECLETQDADGNDSDILQVMAVEELLTYIEYDPAGNDGAGKVTLGKPDVKTFSGILSKYGYDNWEILFESVKAVFAQQKEAAEAE